MLVIEKEAEAMLFDELKRIRYEANGIRFIHYSFSQLADGDKGMVQELLTTDLINNVLDNPFAKVYVCEDSDIIVLGSNLSTKIFDKLTLELFNLLKLKDMRNISKLYDVDNSWPYLYKLVRDKYVLLERKALEEKQKQELERMVNNRQAILAGKAIDADLVATISERRKRRAEINIMIVEDDGFSRKLIRNILNKEYSVIDVEDGKDAISSYTIISPDIVFLDIDLPDVSGHEILETILKLDKEAFVVMLSGNSDQGNVMRAIKNGAKGFVTKPFIKDRLFNYIEDAPSVKAKKHVKA